MKFLEPNELNLKRGDYVLVRLPHPEDATIDEIATDFMHTGEVCRVYHSEGGALRVEVEGLEAKFGRPWTWQNRIAVIDRALKTIFQESEDFIEVSTFGIKAAQNRHSCRNFRGDVTRIGEGEFEVYSFDSGNSYVVKVEEISKHEFRTNCTCADFTNRSRVCKHIVRVIITRDIDALKIAA